MINTSMSPNELYAFIARAKLQGWKVRDFQAGHSIEVDGLQVFRASAVGNERFHVQFNDRIFPDV